jgi:hypothetical protein
MLLARFEPLELGSSMGALPVMRRTASLPCCGLLTAALIQFCGTPAQGEVSDRPSIASDIERTFDHEFLFTTNGDGTYLVYQRLEDQSGISDTDEIVCLLRECLLQIAEVSERSLRSDDRVGLSAIRDRFKAIRDAYWLMRSARREARASAAQEWRDAIAAMGRCLEHEDTC